MNGVAQYRSCENYDTTVKGAKVYVDYINKRLKILDYQNSSENVITEIINFAEEKGLGKIIFNCRSWFLQTFRDRGFVVEGIIKGFFQGEHAYCVSYFIDPGRKSTLSKAKGDYILSQCLSESKQNYPPGKYNHRIRQADAGDIPEMIKLFAKVFKTYPSPIFNRDYLGKVMLEQALYKVAEEDGEIISVASADMDKLNLNAEITDCATFPEHRGKGIMRHLISAIETDLLKKGFCTVYSLSRAVNPGINKTLSRLEYKYGGRLVNNCHICGGFEDMNIWVKKLENKQK
ncbi:MAG: GCN5-related N-acetyltransferase [Desulfotomaculum sp. 46_296]|nr:MAG: GCN5-related N-acetyltransferase [Desulfotomaculum sp. 46_296]HAU32396.1 putative beta-lysine N-acetyltransferase [Desulfotomaculum sp.]